MVISVCGSMTFADEMLELRQQLIALGQVVFLPAYEEHKVDYQGVPDADLGRAKGAFIDQHLGKIRESDAVLLANYTKHGVMGYIGANTLIEAAFAYALGKRIFVLNEIGEQPCRPEMLGMRAVVLGGDLARLVI